MRFDMSNYQSNKDIPNLIGSLETGSPGLLAKAVRQNPYGVLLLDEIEKANKDLLNIFLTILDEGYFTDGFGKRVDCKNLAIIATSNAGSDIIFSQLEVMGVPNQGSHQRAEFFQPAAGSSTGGKDEGQAPSQHIVNYLVEKKIFSPEFINRFDAVVSFNPLDLNSAKQVGQKMIKKISDDIYSLHKIKLTVSNEFLNELISKGYDQKFGARNLERLIRDQIEDRIAKLVLEEKTKSGDTIQL